MRSAALILFATIFASSSTARAQDEEPERESAPEWPDPGSEEPGGPKLFPEQPAKDEQDEAEPEIPESLAEPVYRWSWYGWRNLIGDGAALALLVAFVVTEAQYPPVMIASAMTYAVGGPVAHFSAGNWGRALISLGMRIVGPGLIALAFFAVKCAVDEGCNDDETTLIAVGGGAFLGAFVAAGLDVGLVARQQVQVAPKVGVSPVVGAVPNGPKTFGLAVQF